MRLAPNNITVESIVNTNPTNPNGDGMHNDRTIDGHSISAVEAQTFDFTEATCRRDMHTINREGNTTNQTQLSSTSPARHDSTSHIDCSKYSMDLPR
jgi:hypothetical protein